MHTSRNTMKGHFKLGTKTTLIENFTPRYKSKIKPDEALEERGSTNLSKGQQ